MAGNDKDMVIDATIREAAPYQMVIFGPDAIWADL
jgi:hypothetical protein